MRSVWQRKFTIAIVTILAGLAAFPSAPVLAQDGQLELFDSIKFGGASVRVTGSTNAIGNQMDNRTSSVRVTGGTWQMCKNHNFTGGCFTVTKDTERLPPGINNSISSIRRLQ